ncbi:MAG: hypothetical protein GF417_06830, partial [Candidatus Latescibacteria bacterium]|nr:hypothetical protein [bacterium]MBD3424133.1 hypothetical protein [Candidatus Latescibacterota bacterium]
MEISRSVLRRHSPNEIKRLSPAVIIALLLFVLYPHAALGITVDGDFSPGEWNPVLERRAGNQDQPWGPDNDLINLYLSWDGDSLYAGVEGFSSANNIFFIYLDSSSRTTGAEQNDYYPGFSTQSTGWDPDFIYAVCEMDQGIGASVREINTDGSTAALTQASHGSRNAGQNSNGIGGWEISIPWSTVGVETGGSVSLAAGLGWATDKYDPLQPLGGGSGDELGADSDGITLTLDNPVTVSYDIDNDGQPDQSPGSADSVRVRFRLHYPGAGTVNLAGDFNQWCNPSGSCIDTGIDPMSDTNGDSIWVLEKKLSQDYHEYKFVVDGCQWLSDPLNPDTNPSRNNNSVLVVTDPLVYYLQPLDGSSTRDFSPRISGSLAHSDSTELDLDHLKVYVDDLLVAQGPGLYNSSSGEVIYGGIDSLDEGVHEARITVRNRVGGSVADSSLFHVDADSVPPVISHIPAGSAPEGCAVIIEAAITDDEEVESAALYYRIQGESSYQKEDFTGGFEDRYYAQLPAAMVTEGVVVEYYIRASDGINQVTAPGVGLYSLVVTGDVLPPLISEDYPSPAVISPDGDGKDDLARISFRLSEPALVMLKILTEGGAPVKTVLNGGMIDRHYGSATWNGSDSLQAVVPDGIYRYRITATDGADNSSNPVEGLIEVDRSAPEGTLKLILLFHANQTVNYQGDTANDLCFNGLLRVLRDHPSSSFMLHFSGSLLNDLQWYNFRHNPSTVEMLRAGAADGQFEIVGSTYAQNIPYSTHMWDNNVQIEAQRTVIDRAVGVNPVSFWNAERCWKQELVPMMAENGYASTWVESHILFDSGTSVDEHAVRRTRLGEHEVIIFNDDAELAGNINYAIDSGDTGGLVDYLTYLHSQDTYRDYVICYCEDAEATGLWDYESGQNPQDDWDNLDNMLDVLESIPWVELTTFSEYLSSRHATEMLAPIVDGQANWMVGPSQGAGYNDWFDYNETSPLLAFYRNFFDRKRERVRGVAESTRPNTPAGRLAEHALRNFAAHQFEFGCIGCGSYYCQDYHKMETVEAACLAAEYARDRVPEPAIIERDCNGDSIPDLMLITGEDMFVFSPVGGRMLYWFDLERGDQIAGNEIFMRGYYYRGWREYYQGPVYNDDYHYTEDFVWNASPEYPAAQPYHRVYGIRKKCFNEMVDTGSGPLKDFLNGEYDVTIYNDTLEMIRSGSGITLEKRFYPESGGLSARYRVTNNQGYAINLEHMVENSFCPSLIEVMDYGRESLKYLAGDDTSSVITSSTDGVLNVDTGMRMSYLFTVEPDNLSGDRNVFALELNPRYQRNLGPGESVEYGFTLNAEVVTDSGGPSPRPPSRFRLHQN